MRGRPQPVRALAALGIAVAILGASAVAIKAGMGSFSGAYTVSAVFPEAGQNIYPGSEVQYRGLSIGKVKSIRLDHGKARMLLAIEPQYRVPADATATLDPETVFGNEVVDLSYPNGTRPPYLEAGGTIGQTGINGQLTDLIAQTVPLLRDVNATDLQNLITEANQTMDGMAPAFRSMISEGVKVTNLLASTTDAQQRFLDASNSFAGALAPAAGSINNISVNANQALPVLNRAEASFQRMMDAFTPLASELADLLSRYRPDINTMITSGADISRVLLMQQDKIGALFDSLSSFFKFFGQAALANTLSNGSHFLYFELLFTLSDLSSYVCQMIQPAAAQPQLKPLLQPLLTALTQNPNSYIDCGPRGGGGGAPAAQGVMQPNSSPNAPPPPPPGLLNAGQGLVNQLYGQAAQPQQPVPTPVQNFFGGLAGGLP